MANRTLENIDAQAPALQISRAPNLDSLLSSRRASASFSYSSLRFREGFAGNCYRIVVGKPVPTRIEMSPMQSECHSLGIVRRKECWF